MTRVTDGVWYLRTLMVNVYAVELKQQQGASGARDWMLIDTGLPGFAPTIVRAVERVFGPGTRPKGIVLTHGHFDHVGCVQELSEQWDVPVYASRLEAPFLNGRQPYPPPDPLVGRGAMSVLSPLYPRGPIDLGSRLVLLTDDNRVPGLEGWRVVHTPGHSPGHISLFRDADHTLIAGDAVTTTQQESITAVVSQREELHGPPAYFTIDWIQAAASVAKLAALEPSVLATGHGRPIGGAGVPRQLHHLADTFSQKEVPARGRYVAAAAHMNDDGSMAMPPNPLPALLFKAGLVVAIATGMFVRERREQREQRSAGQRAGGGAPQGGTAHAGGSLHAAAPAPPERTLPAAGQHDEKGNEPAERQGREERRKTNEPVEGRFGTSGLIVERRRIG